MHETYMYMCIDFESSAFSQKGYENFPNWWKHLGFRSENPIASDFNCSSSVLSLCTWSISKFLCSFLLRRKDFNLCKKIVH